MNGGKKPLVLHLISWQAVDEQMDCSDQISDVCCLKLWYEVSRMIHVKKHRWCLLCCVLPLYPKNKQSSSLFMTVNVDYECSSEPATETSNTFAMPDCEWVRQGVADVQARRGGALP